ISTGALFLLIGMLYERRHTRQISDFGGIAKSMPVFTVFFIIVTMSSIGLPGTNGFAGEFMILSGAFLDALPTGACVATNGAGECVEVVVHSWPLLSTIMAIIAVTGV